MNDAVENEIGDGANGSRYWRWLLIVIVIACTIFFTNLGVAQLWDRDEPRNAGCAAEMLQRNDWVVPIFNGELRYQKPVLLYWLTMSAYQLFGVNEFAARLPSALLAVGTIAITYVDRLSIIWFNRRNFQRHHSLKQPDVHRCCSRGYA